MEINLTLLHRIKKYSHNKTTTRKTITSLAIMLAYQKSEWPLLILCPASLRYTWPAEIEKFCPYIPSTAIHVVRGKDDVQFAANIQRWRKTQMEYNKHHHFESEMGHSQQGQKEQSALDIKPMQPIPPVQIVIVTYSLLQSRFPIANILKNCDFQCIIADESHNLKQPTSQRCQLALPLLQRSNRLVLLSGTPALNRPVELWPQLHALDPKGKMFGKFGMRYNEYTKRYCNAKRTRFGWDAKGISNADELHLCLKKVMIRRLKSNVLHDLPAKQRSIVPVPIVEKEKEQESREIMSQLAMARQAVSEIVDLDDDTVANSANWEARRLLMQAYQASGIAKAPATTDYILDWLEGSDPSQKLVVFAHHKQVLDYVENAVSKKYKGRLGVIRIDGSVPPAERALSVKKFQSNASVRLALLSMTAAGIGLTLTAASSIVFAELHWTPGVLAQAEDRCHRIGQANAVNVMYCICKDEEVSVDTRLWAMLGRKVGNLGRVVDGKRLGLNAVERQSGVASDGTNHGDRKAQSGVSAEEDLVSFFASSNPVSASEPKSVLVKGSIQSFFKKQIGKTINEARIVKPKEVSTISLLDDDDESDNDAPDERSLVCSQEAKTPTPFNCHMCTYHNLKNENACAMCGTPRDTEIKQQHSKASDRREPRSSTYENSSLPPKALSPSCKKEWSCSVCTYVNTTDAIDSKSRCEMCGSTTQLDKKAVHRSQDEKNKTVAMIGNCSDHVFQSPNSPVLNSQNSNSFCFENDVLHESEGENDIIEIEDDVQELPKKKKSLIVPPEILSFSVSKNSGRIALHLSSTGQSLYVNFDLSQVLTKECSDRIEETNLMRSAALRSTSSASADLNLIFDDGAVRQVLAALDDESIFSPTLSFERSLDTMCYELKSFVTCYLGLREVEKKAVKESGLAMTFSSVKQNVAKLLVSTVTGATTERYIGGAKERAIENMNNNCATSSDEDVINGRACAWCAKSLFCASNNVIEATYCSHSCAEEGRVRRGGWNSSTKIREQVFALENGVCRKCNVNAHALFCRVKALAPAERLNALLNASWRLPQTRQAVDRLLADPKESDFWQADHIVAVAEGGGGCGLDNLQTLCTPCHGIETASLRSRRKGLPSLSQTPISGGGSQMDIMSAFSNSKQLDCNTKRPKRRRVAD